MNYEKRCLHQWTCNVRELGPVHIERTRERISKKSLLTHEVAI